MFSRLLQMASRLQQKSLEAPSSLSQDHQCRSTISKYVMKEKISEITRFSEKSSVNQQGPKVIEFLSLLLLLIKFIGVSKNRGVSQMDGFSTGAHPSICFEKTTPGVFQPNLRLFQGWWTLSWRPWKWWSLHESSARSRTVEVSVMWRSDCPRVLPTIGQAITWKLGCQICWPTKFGEGWSDFCEVFFVGVESEHKV